MPSLTNGEIQRRLLLWPMHRASPTSDDLPATTRRASENCPRRRFTAAALGERADLKSFPKAFSPGARRISTRLSPCCARARRPLVWRCYEADEGPPNCSLTLLTSTLCDRRRLPNGPDIVLCGF